MFLNNLSAICRQTWAIYATHTHRVSHIAHTPRVTHRGIQRVTRLSDPTSKTTCWLRLSALSLKANSLIGGFVLLRSFAGNQQLALIPLLFHTHSECFCLGDGSPAAVELSCRLSVATCGSVSVTVADRDSSESLRRATNPVYVAFFEWE